MASKNRSRTKIQGTLGDELKSRRIGLCITGSVAVVKSPEIARELIRHGADVISVMSDEAQNLIQPELMRWATQNDVIISVTGRMEHIRLTEEGPERLDLILIAPATANTLSKIATGVSDTTVTLLASCALGSNIPIVVAPSMHESLWSNPAVESNLDRLKKLGVDILEPLVEEGKAKITPTEDIVEAVIRRLHVKDMAGLKVLVTAGPTYEHLDPIRMLTNRSSGKMGFALAKEALRRGAEVTLVSGPTSLSPPSSIDFTPIETTRQLYDTVVSKLKEERYDLFLAAAAPEDFRPVKPSAEKMSSRIARPLDLKFEATEKVIDSVKKIQRDIFLVSFKAEWGLNRDDMIKRAKVIIQEAEADMVAVNDAAQKGTGFKADTNQILLVKKNGSTIDIPLALKQTVARRILDTFLEVTRKHSQ